MSNLETKTLENQKEIVETKSIDSNQNELNMTSKEEKETVDQRAIMTPLA